MSVRSIAAAYKDQKDDLAPFFAGWPQTLLDCAPVTGACWPGLTEELDAYQRTIGSTASSGGDCYIVTGQQPALFTGPLYTVYKIATAIRLADAVSKRHGIRCTPVFWQGSDDHDFEEARTATVLTKNHEPLSLSYEPLHDVAGLAMHRVPLDGSIHDLIDQAADSTPGSEFREEVRGFLHDSARASSSLANWNARLIARLFAGTGLVVFTSESPSARLAARAVIEKEIRDPLASTRLVNEAGARLATLEYERQVSKGESECGFFLEVNERRCKVTYQDGAFLLPAEAMQYTQAELLGVLANEPGRFSPNVALRCIVQQRLFPVAAYVAGPGEVAYWAQFKSLFDYHEQPMPVVYPRAHCVLTSQKLNKLRAKLGLQTGAGVDWSAPDALVSRALRATAHSPLIDAFQKKKAAVESELQSLTTEMGNAPVPVSTLVDRIADAFDSYERILMRADETRYETVRQQVARLCNAFAPFRKPQERVFTIFSFLFEHGWDLVPRIVREIDFESFEPNEIEL